MNTLVPERGTQVGGPVFRVLGPMELPGDVRGPRVRRLAALLVLNSDEVVPVDAMVDELWGNDPPRQANHTIRTHIYHLRRMLAVEHRTVWPADEAVLVTRQSGYQLCVHRHHVDHRLFAQLVERGRTQLRTGAVAEASETLRSALTLWRGCVLADLVPGEIIARHIARLADLRTRARELRIEAEMQLGRHRDLIPELRGMIADDPLNEWLHARLIETLHTSGSRSAALAAYQDVRVLLDKELGLAPTDELRRLQNDILTGRESRTLREAAR